MCNTNALWNLSADINKLKMNMKTVCSKKMNRRTCNAKRKKWWIRTYWVYSVLWNDCGCGSMRAKRSVFYTHFHFKWSVGVQMAKRDRESEIKGEWTRKKPIFFHAVISHQKSHIYSSYTSYFNTLVLSFFAGRCACVHLSKMGILYTCMGLCLRILPLFIFVSAQEKRSCLRT